MAEQHSLPETSDMLAIYERENEEREARTCSGCEVEAGSKRDNDDGRRVWWQWDCDDFDLMPCSVCRPAEAAKWLRAHGKNSVADDVERRAGLGR